MRTYAKILVFILCFGQLNSNAGNPKIDSLSCLLLDGKIDNANEDKSAPCHIELWLNNTVVDSIDLAPGKSKFKFVLNRNDFYTIRIVKKGFTDKLVCVNTELPLEVGDFFRYKFSTSLLAVSSSKTLNQDALDFPVTIIHFHQDWDEFDYDEKYTADIKQELYLGNSTASK